MLWDRASVWLLGEMLKDVACGALVGARMDDHPPSHPQNQLDAQRGIGPVSLACKAWGQGV